MSPLDHLRVAIDLPALALTLDKDDEDKGGDGDGVLRWWQQAQAVVAREVAAGRVTVLDARAVQQETLDLMATVHGLQFVTNERWGEAGGDKPTPSP